MLGGIPIVMIMVFNVLFFSVFNESISTFWSAYLFTTAAAVLSAFIVNLSRANWFLRDRWLGMPLIYLSCAYCAAQFALAFLVVSIQSMDLMAANIAQAALMTFYAVASASALSKEIRGWELCGAFIEGVRFGLLLQIAVGPVCLMVFNTAGRFGFPSGSWAALAVTLVDGLYIFLAAVGVAVFLRGEKVTNTVRKAGACVLVLFGLDIVLGALGMSLLPRIPLFEGAKAEGIFLKAVFLTGSNPLTIVFWGGVFSAGVASKNMDGKRIFLFGTGCASATLVFLNAVALAGSLVRTFLPQAIMTCLNVAVGIAVIIFAFQT